jgi:hypothetical protein
VTEQICLLCPAKTDLQGVCQRLGKTISSIFPFSILCSDDCRLCEFHCCGSRACSNKIVLGFYLVEFLDSAVLVIEFMAPPTIQKVKDGVGIYLLCSLLIVVPWYSGCKILIGKSTVIPCFCNGLSSLKSRKIRISKNFCVPFFFSFLGCWSHV